MGKRETLVAEIGRLARTAVGRRYSDEMRQRILEYIEERHGEGVGRTRACDELGLDWGNVNRWRRGRARKPATAFRRVRVVAPTEPRAAAEARIVVHGPGGLRVEGLDVEGVVDLLRRLG
jgi:transposase